MISCPVCGCDAFLSLDRYAVDERGMLAKELPLGEFGRPCFLRCADCLSTVTVVKGVALVERKILSEKLR